MGLLVIVLGAAVYFMEIRGAEEREEAERVADRLLSFETEDVTGVRLETAEGTIVLSQGDDASWRITEPYDLAANDSAVSTMIGSLQRADHQRLVEEAATDLGRFGLAEPEVTITLELADGSSQSLAFGDGTPVGFNAFVSPGGSDSVYLAAATLKDGANKELFDLRDRSILSFETSDVSRLEVTDPDVATTIERRPDAADGIDRWQITAPLQDSADADAISSLLTRLRSDQAAAYPTDAPTEEQLAAYGLDSPQIEVRVWTADDSVLTLQIGAESEDPAGRFGRRLGSDAVFVVPESLVDALPEDVAALRNRTVVEFARDRVNRIALASGGDDVVLEKDGIDWRILEPRALEGDSATVSSLLSAALDLRAREFADGAPSDGRFGFGSPHARVSFELEALPGDDTGGGQAAETFTLLVGGTTEFDPEEESDDATAEGEEEAEAAEPVAGRYVAVEGGATVFSVVEEDLENLMVDLFALRSKTLFSFTQADLTRLELATPAAAHVLVKSEEGDWVLEGGPEGDLSSSVNAMLGSLNFLRMESIVADEGAEDSADAAALGLDPPMFQLRLDEAGSSVGAVFIGAEVPEEELDDEAPFAPQTQAYARVEGVGGIFRVTARARDTLQDVVDAISALSDRP